ncbi:Cytochrome P450 [Sphingopyxis sp. YR583]|uniref:cytochrome P450 n=1 Tax=Sphingopyxis sp. YR583 TaxID=1881047 RepID=UPI0008A72856|nr:cytochrome P450 [Sphingopyxis sp. YR583]SEH19154.1 Cytochrome P450 [Sphingopyxis sp. YR583]
MQDRFFEPETTECPFPYYQALRDEKPVFYSDRLGAFVVTRYDDVQKVALDQKTFSSMTPVSNDLGDLNYAPMFAEVYDELGVPPQVPTLVRTGGLEHRRYRSMVDRYFGAQAVNRLRPRLTEIVDRLIDSFVDAEKVDLQRDFCMKLPLETMCELLGLPPSEADRLAASAEAQTRLANGTVETPEARLALHRDQARFHRFLLDLFDERRREPDGSILSTLLNDPPAEGDPLDDGELCSLISLMNIGGNETTTGGLGNMFHLCFSQPGFQEKLRAEPQLIPKFVEEALRMESPVIMMLRTPIEDTELDGVKLPKGSIIMVHYAAANRDERKFACPEKLDLERKGARSHLAFGAGVHYCLGSTLARTEMEISLNRVLSRMHNIRIDSADPLKHQHKVVVRSLHELPITFERTN